MGQQWKCERCLNINPPHFRYCSVKSCNFYRRFREEGKKKHSKFKAVHIEYRMGQSLIIYDICIYVHKFQCYSLLFSKHLIQIIEK